MRLIHTQHMYVELKVNPVQEYLKKTVQRRVIMVIADGRRKFFKFE